MPIKNNIPTVIVSNFAEAHVDFLGRCADPKEREELILAKLIMRTERYCGRVTLSWLLLATQLPMLP